MIHKQIVKVVTEKCQFRSQGIFQKGLRRNIWGTNGSEILMESRQMLRETHQRLTPNVGDKFFVKQIVFRKTFRNGEIGVN